MGEFKNKIAGKTRQVVGKYTGNRSMATKGTVQKGVGRVQGAAKNVKAGIRKAASKRPSAKMTKRTPTTKRTVTYSKRKGY